MWVTLFRMGCDIENPSSRCPFRLIRARAGNLPAWCPGTTPLGLFILWEWTHGSASAAQPWALGQNPVGIPGGKIGQRLCTIPPGFASIHGFPSPTSTTLCHKARGCEGRRTTPGGRARGATTTTWLCRGYERVGCPAQGGLRCCKAISRCPFRRIRARAGNLAAWCPGTTPLGGFILWEWTQCSASAAQPRALGQNPVGIPGGGRAAG